MTALPSEPFAIELTKFRVMDDTETKKYRLRKGRKQENSLDRIEKFFHSEKMNCDVRECRTVIAFRPSLRSNMPKP